MWFCAKLEAEFGCDKFFLNKLYRRGFSFASLENYNWFTIITIVGVSGFTVK